MVFRVTRLILLAGAAGLLLAACEQQGSAERAGEEVDEAVDTLKRGGEESPQNRLDDAADEARQAADELQEEDAK